MTIVAACHRMTTIADLSPLSRMKFRYCEIARDFDTRSLERKKKISIVFMAGMALASFGCKKKGGGDALGKMTEMADDMCKCKDKDCADKVVAKMKTWSDEQAKNADKNATADTNPDDAKKFQEVNTKYSDCMTKAMTGGAPPAGDKPAGDKPAGDKPAEGDKKPEGDKPAMAGGDLPAECNDYKAAIEKLASCDKLPQASKDALKTSYETMSAGWKDFGTMPAEAKKSIADGCKQAADAVNQTAQVCK
jgi:hypothetical protein